MCWDKQERSPFYFYFFSFFCSSQFSKFCNYHLGQGFLKKANPKFPWKEGLQYFTRFANNVGFHPNNTSPGKDSTLLKQEKTWLINLGLRIHKQARQGFALSPVYTCPYFSVNRISGTMPWVLEPTSQPAVDKSHPLLAAILSFNYFVPCNQEVYWKQGKPGDKNFPGFGEAGFILNEAAKRDSRPFPMQMGASASSSS